jgi:hypothetical protein
MRNAIYTKIIDTRQHAANKICAKPGVFELVWASFQFHADTCSRKIETSRAFVVTCATIKSSLSQALCISEMFVVLYPGVFLWRNMLEVLSQKDTSQNGIPEPFSLPSI